MDGDISNKPAADLPCDDVANKCHVRGTVAVPLNVCSMPPSGIDKTVFTGASLLLPVTCSKAVPLVSESCESLLYVPTTSRFYYPVFTTVRPLVFIKTARWSLVRTRFVMLSNSVHNMSQLSLDLAVSTAA